MSQPPNVPNPGSPETTRFDDIYAGLENPYPAVEQQLPPRKPKRNGLLGGLIAVLALVLVSGVAWAVLRGIGEGDTSAEQSNAPEASLPATPETQNEPRSSEPAPSPVQVTVIETVSAAPVAPTVTQTVEVVSPEVQAESRLESYRQQARGALNTNGRWVAVLSAKYPGVTDPLQTAANGSNTFYFEDILAEHEQLRARFADTRIMMLRQADFGKYARDLWYTIADPGGLSSQEAGTKWCESAFPEFSGEELLNHCMPRQLTPPRAS